MRLTCCQPLMQILRRLARWFVLAGCGLLASCIDGREEFWLAGDGSGRAEIRYTQLWR